MSIMYRQGDVLLIGIDPVSGLGPSVTAEAAVLARGEATGHAHVLRGPARYYDGGASAPLIEVLAPATLRHEDAAGGHAEHHPVDLPAGWYRQVQQRVYVPATRWRPSRSRRVGD